MAGIGFGRARQQEIYVEGAAGRYAAAPAGWENLERAAREAMSPTAWGYIAGGAGLEATMRANREALDAAQIVPRMLRDVEHRDLSIELFGERFPTPLLTAPIGVLELMHREADLAVARAAAALGIPMIVSCQASMSMEQIAEAAPTGRRWFQLYWSRSNALVESLVRRAEQAGYGAIVVTLDTTLLGWRPRDLDLGSLPFLQGMGIAQYTSDPVFQQMLDEPVEAGPATKPSLAAIATLFAQARRVPGGMLSNLRSGRARRAVATFVRTYSRPSLTWDDLPFLRSVTKLPILLKGIQHPDDARRAVAAGMDGLIVSNHGGRQVDGAVGSFDALPRVVEAVGGRIPVLFDSGVRGGSDVLKALAAGARAVCIGRPYAYGLAVGGEAGVRSVLQGILAETDLSLGLSGHTAIAELSADSLMHRVR